MDCTNTSVTIQKSGLRILLGRMHLMHDSLPSLTRKSAHSRMEFIKSHKGLAERTMTFSAILPLLLQVPMTQRGMHNTAHILYDASDPFSTQLLIQSPVPSTFKCQFAVDDQGSQNVLFKHQGFH